MSQNGTLSPFNRALLTSRLCAAVQGRGQFFYPNGEHYDGEWSNGVRSGWGTMHYKDGSTYEGRWLSDQPNGMGVLRLRECCPPSACPLRAVRCCPPAVSAIPICGCHPAALQQDCRLSSSSPGLEREVHRLSKGRPCTAQARKPTRMKAYFCCDLHLNDWDGSG